MNSSTLEANTLNLGSSVTVLDPCYIPGSMHMEMKIEIPYGYTWEPYVEMTDEGFWGNRVAKLGITRNGFRNITSHNVGYAGVDSGQMMIIDTDAIRKWEDTEYDDESAPELSYAGACRITLSEEQAGVIEDLAVVSSSGLGDGSYPVFVYEDALGQVERIEVDFLLKDDEDDFWEDFYEEEEEIIDDEW